MSILVCLTIAASFLGLFPDRYGAILAGRAAIAETVAVNSSVFITQRDLRRMEANLQVLVSRNDEMLSAAVKQKDGKAVTTVGDHDVNWQPLEEGLSTDAQIVVPIWEGDKEWGRIELRFSPLKRQDWLAFFFEPLTLFVLFIASCSFFIFRFYLGKMLKQLDPSQAIPDRVRSALDTMAEGLLVLDAKHNIVLANEAFATLVGKTPEALLGYRVDNFPWGQIQGKGLLNNDFPWRLALDTSEVQMNHMLRLQLEGQASHTFMTNCSPVLGPNGKAAGVLVSFDDITELEEKEVQLRLSKEEAEEANRAKSDFLANMSHEIRTPMNAILGFTEVLKRGYGKNQEDSKRYLATIASSGKHLLDLINDILDLSKVEAGRIEVETLPCAAHHIVHEVVKIMGVKASEKGISLTFDAVDAMPERVQTDPGKLRQILTNLVGNAIKFTEQGSVTLTTHYSDRIEPPRLSIAVSDTGIGMTQSQADGVFSPFVQADSSITRRFGGTGLGLTISKRFAEALGGDITVRSEPGKGSVFTVTIEADAVEGAPRLSPADIITQDFQEAPIDQTQWVFPPAKVLVVDDGDENRDLLEVVLGDLGLQVDTCVNGKQGLDKVLETPYDLVLMDVQMPEMDGYTAVRLMREQGVTIPVIALTAHAMKGAEQACLNAGYSGYMTKPIDIDGLIKRLARELKGQPLVASMKQTDLPVLGDNERVLVADHVSKVMLKTPIRSSLPTEIPKYRSLVERFVTRLALQFKEIEKAANDQDYETLADLAHWLKGSAGSVGFHDFTEPAEQLEQYAKARDNRAVIDKVAEIGSLIARIELLEKATVDVPLIDVPVVDKSIVDNAAIEAFSDVAVQPQSSVTDSSHPEPIRSDLVTTNPKLRPMAEKFVKRLNHQFRLMEQAAASLQFDELADLAHWLKGSAGTLGFHVFTEPAESLECCAKSHNRDGVVEKIAGIGQLMYRIELNGSASPLSEQKTEVAPIDVGPIRSRLVESNPKLKPMAEKFVKRLSDQITLMDQALNAGCFDELADLAHWLKGSAGTLGFHDFTDPACELETSAKAQQPETASQWLVRIKMMQAHIDLSEEADTAACK